MLAPMALHRVRICSTITSASWRSVAYLCPRPTKPLRFTPLSSNHRSTDTGSVGPASIANTIASTTDSSGAPCSALRLWNSHNYRVLCLQVQIFVGKDKPFRAGHSGRVPSTPESRVWRFETRPKGRAYYRLWRKRVVNDPALLPNLKASPSQIANFKTRSR